MGSIALVDVYPNGYVVEFAPIGPDNTTEECQSWILLPAENLWPAWLRGVLYFLGIVYSFVGVTVGSDIFMTSIEVITSRKRTIVIWDEEEQQNVKKEVFVWNETVANLTLLALGSSAPEILLAIVETITELLENKSDKNGGLGFHTIVGSAAFNLFVITGICIISVPSPSYKPIRDLGVFILTAIWSLWAYVWLLIVLLWYSPTIVEPWEAWVTLLMFPVLVLTAYSQDNGWWLHKFKRTGAVSDVSKPAEDQPVINGIGSRRGSIGGMRPIPLSPEKRRKITKAVSFEMSIRRQETNPQLVATPKAQPSPTLSYRKFARARFRHAAIRSLGGIRRAPLDPYQTDSEPVKDNQDPKLMNVVSKLVNSRRLYSNNTSIKDETSGNVSFASSTYSVLESAGDLVIEVLLNRKRRPKGEIIIPMTNEQGKFDTQLVSGVVSVDYETREGTAKINKDFKYSTGTLIFTEEDFSRNITVPIINDTQYNPDTDFYIILKNPSEDVVLGDPSVTRVTIIDDDKPGDFVLEKSQLYADMEKGEVYANVLRQSGCDGKVHVHYATINGTAIGGESDDPDADYVQTSGVLEFKHQEASKIITIKVNNSIKEVKNFVLVLRNPSQGSHLGEHSAAVVNMNLQAGGLNHLSRVLVEHDDTSWSGQFANAMTVGGEIDDDGLEISPTRADYIFHFLSMPWKLFFAFCPTRNALGGYPAFVISLLMIGAITAIIEQLGGLLGCVVNLRTQVTGITFIALGTSLPDTIASRTAALQDNYADASIGNITGSNSVNVFLGLGLPWVIRVMYHYARGTTYEVNTESLGFSVTIFGSFGALCIVILLLRRFILGGELGGSQRTKWTSGVFLFIMWFTFIVVSSLKAYEYF